jgi:hypothetical protein
MPALLPAGDESAMNFERAGVFFGIIFYFPHHFSEWGVTFAQNVASLSIVTEQGASGRSYGLGPTRKGHNTYAVATLRTTQLEAEEGR